MKRRSAMSTNGPLIVLAAFDRNEEGWLVPAFDAREVDTEEHAVREGRLLARQYAGVVAWSHDADPAFGDYGPPQVLFQAGEIPELE
jgi:hypothetical protein